MGTLISHSAEETLAIGEAWGRAAAPGLVIGLTGDLGAGKTQLARGIARGLGITARVHSPTFTLVNQYAGGRLPMFHVDLYRLQTAREIREAGLEEYFQPAGVAVIEWAEKVFPVQSPKSKDFGELSRAVQSRPAQYRQVMIESLGENERRITYEDFGA
jgi:tRNA threonylcarbamoyladenosine biosynthesis protein TsaE